MKFDVSLSLTYKRLGFLDITDLKILENEGILMKASKVYKSLVFCLGCVGLFLFVEGDLFFQ